MIGVAQGPLTLGGGGSVPAFPTNFSNINPEQRTAPIRFGGGGTATMELGGASVGYNPNLTLSGGAYGQREMGARDFAPAALPQAQPRMLEQMYTNPFATQSQRMGENLSLGLTPVAPTTRLPLEEGPLSMNIAAPRSAEAQGRQAVQTPFGAIYATAEQAANMMTPRTMAQQSSRTPEQQQALLAQMRERGAAIGQRLATQETERQQGLSQRYYAFRQGLEQRRAQEALSTERGRSPDVMRGAQALAQAERWRQAQQGRSPMSREPLVMGANAPQPAAPSFPTPSTGGPSTMAVGGSPFSMTQFAQRIAQPEPSPLAGFTAAINPATVDRRFRRLPLGMRRFGVI